MNVGVFWYLKLQKQININEMIWNVISIHYPVCRILSIRHVNLSTVTDENFKRFFNISNIIKYKRDVDF